MRSARAVRWFSIAFLLATLPCCSSKKEEVKFAPYSAEAASVTGKPLVILATADWCNPCQRLHREALSDADVKTALDSFTRLEIDHSSRSDRTNEVLVGLKIDGLPTLVFYDAQGTEVARLEGARSAEEVIAAAKKASGR